MQIKRIFTDVKVAKAAMKQVDRLYEKTIDEEIRKSYVEDNSERKSIALDNYLEIIENCLADKKREKKLILKYIFTGEV